MPETSPAWVRVLCRGQFTLCAQQPLPLASSPGQWCGDWGNSWSYLAADLKVLFQY